MRLLITNDDGIDAFGLQILAKTCLKHGHQVFICAPTHEQSAVSMHITLRKPLTVHKRFDLSGVPAYSVDGTPADCVRLAAQLFSCPMDLCISGINNGDNAGAAIYYSGTVAAAREAAMHYLPAIAASICLGANEEMVRAHAEFTVNLAEKIQHLEFPRAGVLNINAPAVPRDSLKPMRICPISTAFYLDHYDLVDAHEDDAVYQVRPGYFAEESTADSDVALLKQGYVTCTLLGALSDDPKRTANFLQEIDS